MKIFFLSAFKPIVKEYSRGPKGEIVKHSYPFVYEVKSYEEDPKDLKALADLMNKHAKLGRCMVKGELSRQLMDESRKGTTDPDAKTDWICLDLDGVENYQTVDLFLHEIGCGDVDHIVQWSSSMGIENNTGFRCHIFMRLITPVHPQLLKHWLMDLNLRVPTLNAQLELTKTANALRWPLDVTTCQNDKLLYIAPPLLSPSIPDPFAKTKRITYMKRARQLLILPDNIPNRDTLRAMSDKRIAELRAAQNMPKRKATKYKFTGTTEYMVSPDSALISEQKTERGYVYFNLNGGDSWAYYHPEDNPTYIHNFKGEPIYRTQDLLPEYWADLQLAHSTYQPTSQGLVHLAFRDFKTSEYYNGSYNPSTNKLNISIARSETQLRQYLEQRGQSLGSFVPDWNLSWNPHNPNVVDPFNKDLNIFQASDFYHLDPRPKAKKVPPTIYKIISHVLADDTPTINHFLNWLACIVQFQTRTGTAWVWQGTQGTGKGVLFHQIITPLLGEINVVSKRMDELESEFTSFMENKFVVFIDEIEAGRSLYHSKITARLKNLIVEPTISIRKMYNSAYMATNYSSMIFASNKPAAVEVAPDDRRFNIGPYQEHAIQVTPAEIQDLIPQELEQFFGFLMVYPANQELARTTLKSEARTTMMAINRTAIDTVTDALLAGDLAFFWEHLSTDSKSLNPILALKHSSYRDLIINLINTLDTKLTRDELYTLAEWCVGNMPTSPNKFTSLLKHHKIHLIQVWKGGRNVRGIDVNWAPDPNWLAQAQSEIAAGLV